MTRAVRIPTGRMVTLGAYCSAWRTVKAMPPRQLVPGWSHFPEEAADILGDLRDGMHDRMSRHLPWWGKGRKWEGDWQRAALQCSRRVNAWRVVVRPGDVPHDFRARLAHRITWPEEE